MSECTISIQERLVEELRGPAGDLLNEHLKNAKIWYPNEVVEEAIPQGFTADIRPGKLWDPQQYPLPKAVCSALFVNLLTEDNLPYYTGTLDKAPKDHPLGVWRRQWTAEEARHSITMRDWITKTRALDPRALEDGRMAQMSGGVVPQPETFSDLISYVSFQEKATQVAHSNTGKHLGKELGGQKVMAKVAGDETKHHIFYRNLTEAAIEIDPSTMVISIAKVIKEFKMPGTGIPNYDDHEKNISLGGIFGATELLNNVFIPTLDYWQLDKLTGLSPEAEKAQERLSSRIAALGKFACFEQAEREKFAASAS